jgi:dienelactone hydrolase
MRPTHPTPYAIAFLSTLLTACALNSISGFQSEGIKPLDTETLRTRMSGNTTYLTDPAGRDYPIYARPNGSLTARLSGRNHVSSWRMDGTRVCMDGALGGKELCLQVFPAAGNSFVGCLDSHNGNCMVKVRFAPGNPENLPLTPDPFDQRLAEAAASTAPFVKPEGPGPHPLVVLIHGCSGVAANIPLWQDFLRRNGYATLVIDSFRPRGVTEICTDFTRVLYGERVQDAYAALRRAASEPGIDAGRIALMGFSHGAGVVLDAVTADALKVLPATQPRPYRAVALYPECSNRQELRVGTPTLIAVGAADDWTPAKPCETLVAAHTKEPPGLAIKTYAGAQHAFDNPNLPTVFRGEVMNPNRAGGFGGTVGGSAIAYAQAQEDVLRFLAAR